MNAFWIALKELRGVARERSIVVAIAVQAVVAATSAFLAVGLLGLYDPDQIDRYPEATIAYVGDESFLERLGKERNMDLLPGDVDDALALFQAGEADAVVQADRPPDGTLRVLIIVPEGEVQTTLLVTQLKDILQDIERSLRIEHRERLRQALVEVDAPSGAGLGHGFMYATLLPLLVLTPVFLSGAIAADAIVHERQHRTLMLLRSSPTGTTSIVAGLTLTPLMLAPAQVAAWCGLLAWNGHPVDLPLLLAWTLILTLAVCAAGILATSSAAREGEVQATYAASALVLATLSLLLPRDPLNIITLAATGGMDHAAWTSLAVTTAAAVALAAIALGVAHRQLRTDRL